MFDLNQERGSTLILVTHDTSIAMQCRQTITIAAGRLLQSADMSALEMPVLWQAD